jgi:hypothetical protein
MVVAARARIALGNAKEPQKKRSAVFETPDNQFRNFLYVLTVFSKRQQSDFVRLHECVTASHWPQPNGEGQSQRYPHTLGLIFPH